MKLKTRILILTLASCAAAALLVTAVSATMAAKLQTQSTSSTLITQSEAPVATTSAPEKKGGDEKTYLIKAVGEKIGVFCPEEGIEPLFLTEIPTTVLRFAGQTLLEQGIPVYGQIGRAHV